MEKHGPHLSLLLSGNKLQKKQQWHGGKRKINKSETGHFFFCFFTILGNRLNSGILFSLSICGEANYSG
ncbi:MAG TPA: hypothetical protein VLY20_05925 [Nitrospiria bacterium]|nr:hypothetical protein [Nitrospiria bacterium]